MEKQENLVFIGSPGVGKTHLAISIGIEAYRQEKRTLFINFHELLSCLRVDYEIVVSIDMYTMNKIQQL
jgi:DNA replication protein DnaC